MPDPFPEALGLLALLAAIAILAGTVALIRHLFRALSRAVDARIKLEVEAALTDRDLGRITRAIDRARGDR